MNQEVGSSDTVMHIKMNNL